jgi:hypothetical protein
MCGYRSRYSSRFSINQSVVCVVAWGVQYSGLFPFLSKAMLDVSNPWSRPFKYSPKIFRSVASPVVAISRNSILSICVDIAVLDNGRHRRREIISLFMRKWILRLIGFTVGQSGRFQH